MIEEWRNGWPYAHLVYDIPQNETDLISTYSNLWWVHRGVSTFAEGYSSDLEFEVDYVHGVLYSDSEEEYDIVQVNGYPFFLVSP